MKKFSFSLKAVQGLRAMQREQSEIKLSQLIAQVEQARQKLRAVEQQRIEATQAYIELLSSKGSTSQEATWSFDYIGLLSEREKQEQVKVQSLEKMLAVQHRSTMVAIQNSKIMDKLHTTDLNRYKVQAVHEEQLQLDEITTLSFSHRTREGQ